MTYIFKPVDGSLIFHLHPEGSRRSDSKVNNLAINSNNRFFPAMTFDGIDDYVNVSSLNSTVLIPPFTISVRVISTNNTFAYRRGIICNSNLLGTEHGWFISKESDNTFSFKVARTSLTIRSDTSTYSNIPYVDNLPHCITVTLLSNGAHYIYMDGVKQTAGTSSSEFLPATANTPLKFGVTYGDVTSVNYGYPWSGLIGETVIWNRILSDDEIYSNATNGVINSTNLLFWANKNGSGSTLLDYSGNNNHGTIYGAVWNDGKANGILSGGVTYKNSPSGFPIYNFDGTGYIRVVPVRSARTNMSVFIWAKATEESYLLGRYDTGLSDRSWIIGTDVSGEKRLRILLSDDGTYGASHSKDYLTTANVFDNQWHLYGFTWNAGTLKLFVDGREQSVTKTYDAAFTSLKAANTDLIIGARFINGSPAAYLTGQQGHQWIFNKTLLTSEAMQLFNETRRYYGR